VPLGGYGCQISLLISLAVMLYKVTPAMLPGARKPLTPVRGETKPRRRRPSSIFDTDGNEVLITLMCLKCHHIRPLAQFGLRRMPDGAIRNQPWCRTCRGAATPKRKAAVPQVPPATEATPDASGTPS
jgi:hypothetical protein